MGGAGAEEVNDLLGLLIQIFGVAAAFAGTFVVLLELRLQIV